MAATKRMTVRTTRMLQEAIARCSQGEPVVVFAADKSHAKRLLRRAEELVRVWFPFGTRTMKFTVYLSGRLHIERSTSEGREYAASIDFEVVGTMAIARMSTMFLKHGLPSEAITFLADHYAIESALAPALEMLHRFDPPPPPEDSVRMQLTECGWLPVYPDYFSRVYRSFSRFVFTLFGGK